MNNNLKELNELYEIVNQLKKCTLISNSLDVRAKEKETFNNFEEQNERVYYINLFVLIRLYSKEIAKIEEKYGKFELEEYYTLIEELNLPYTIHNLYMEMPERIKENKILSYVTDIPSFMGLKKN